MRLLIKGRQSGKTTGLIYASEATGYPIAVENKTRVKYIEDMAEEIGCIIPQPVTFSELRDGIGRSNRLYDTVLVDEVQSILASALSEYLHCNVKGATLTDILKEYKR